MAAIMGFMEPWKKQATTSTQGMIMAGGSRPHSPVSSPAPTMQAASTCLRPK